MGHGDPYVFGSDFVASVIGKAGEHHSVDGNVGVLYVGGIVGVGGDVGTARVGGTADLSGDAGIVSTVDAVGVVSYDTLE